jgi:metallo-beta-lactamase family protein
VLIPAFAVERTQELIYILADAYRKNQIPKNMPIFLDSPLAIKATEIFRDHPDFFDEQTRATLARGETPLNFPNLRFTPSTEESRKINEYQGTAVIMAGSGMANAGRIKHHLKHNLWKPDSHVVIVGFQAQGTTGRLLVDGAKKVKIFREDVVVKAKVHTIGGFSAHADQGDLLEWLSHLIHPNLKVYLMHGEETSALDFAKVARERFPGIKFHVPRWKEIITLTPRKRKAKAAKPAAAPVPEPRPAPEPTPAPAPAPTQVADGGDVLGAPAAPDEVIGLVQRADLLRHQLREITRDLQRRTKPLAPGRAEAWEKALAELEGLIDQEETGPGGQPRR